MSNHNDLIHGNWLEEYMQQLQELNPPPEPVVPEPSPPAEFINNECYQLRFCPYCVVNFARPGDLDRHLYEMHPDYFEVQAQEVQQGGGNNEPQITFRLAQHAINGLYVTYNANIEELAEYKNIDSMFHGANTALTNILQTELAARQNLRVVFSILAVFTRTNPATGEVEFTNNERMPTMRSFDHVILDPSMIQKILESAMNKIAVEVEDFVEHGSGWVLDHVEEFAIRISTFSPISGGSFLPLPPLLERKKFTLLNIENTEENDEQDHLKCFVWSILAHPKVAGIPEGRKFKDKRYKMSKKVQTYKPYLNKLNLCGLAFPMTIEQIPKFEKQNPEIGITVIAYELTEDDYKYDSIIPEEEENDRTAKIRRKNKSYNQMQEEIRSKCFPRHVCNENRPIQIDLLLLVADTNEVNIRPDHFVLIKNLISLLHTNNNPKTSAVCRNCLQTFREVRTLEDHIKYCPSLRLQKTTFPKSGENICKFTSWERTQPVPFRIYADFESLLVPVENDSYSKTQTLNRHVPCGYSWVCVDHEGYRYRSNYHRAISESENVSKRFLLEILELVKDLQHQMQLYQEIASRVMTEFGGNTPRPPASRCCFCNEKFADFGINKWMDKSPVRHHSHLKPWNFIGYAHNSCNLQARMSDIVPVIIHNFSSYDSHFIVQACDKNIVKDVEIIAKTTEKFLSVLVNGCIRFLDSYAFFSKPLSDLVRSLPKNDPNSFRITRQQFGYQDINTCVADVLETIKNQTEDQAREACIIAIQRNQKFFQGDVSLLLEKQAYPYSYMTSLEKFNEGLPPIEAFYNDLTEQDLDQSVYKHLVKVWHSFDLRSIGQLHDIYVTLDCSLLADVFEYNRKILQKHYGLDIAHYFSLPMVSKDAMLKKTKAKLELLTDSTMYCWLELGLRGGLVSVGSLRCAQANNPYMGDEYDQNKSTSYITFLDSNNLYGWAMCEPLPEKDFEWVEDAELNYILQMREKFILSLEPQGRKGYAFEVDLSVPEKMHEYFNEYPPAPVRRIVQKEQLSSLQNNIIDDENIPFMLKTERLIADLLPKNNMVCHYRNLQMWIKLGCKLGKIYKVLKFTQNKWMKPYIDFNTQMRMLASSDIEIDFWKGMNNSGFGKMIERLRDRQNIIPILTETKGRRYNKKPTVKDMRIIHEGLVFLLMKKLAVKLNNPIAVGFACLELSKLVMFNFHYNYMYPKFGNMARLLYSDTDSFAYFIEYPNSDGNIYKDFEHDEEVWFDMSDYDENDPTWKEFYSPTNRKVLAKMKDEHANCIITHMVCPKPKMYALRYIKCGVSKICGSQIREICTKKKAKGLSKAVVKNHLNQDHYVNALEGNQNPDVSMTTIRSFNHVLYTTRLIKKSVSGLDVKRYCLEDCVTTLAFGHKDIPLYQ